MSELTKVLSTAINRVRERAALPRIQPADDVSGLADPELAADEKARILNAYRRLRAAGKSLQNTLAEQVIRSGGFDDSARKLGLLRGRTIVMDSEHDMAVMADHALFCHRVNGLNVVERYSRELLPGDADSRAWLNGLAASRFSIFMAQRIITTFGLEMIDIFSGESFLVVDVNLSITAEPGFTMASRLVRLDGFWATTGAVLPIGDEEPLERIEQHLKRLRIKPGDVPSLDSIKMTNLQTFITRTCLEAHSTAMLQTTDPGEMALPRAPAPGVYARKMKVGRNERCPCGSGEKYKRCCGRGVR